MPISPDHFKGKTVVEHLREARTKGAFASTEMHGIEMPGRIAAAADTAKEIAFATLIIWVIGSQLFPFISLISILLLFCTGWCIWKTGRSALLATARIERLHRLITEEKWEIEHHRDQEREELSEIYQAKGFTPPLLDHVLDVLMADDNRLLQVMLEEELGLTLEIYEHPLKQCSGAAIGGMIASICILLAYLISPLFGIHVAAALIISISTWITARLERNQIVDAIIWNLALGVLTGGFIYFLTKLLPTP